VNDVREEDLRLFRLLLGEEIGKVRHSSGRQGVRKADERLG